jgi:hypothetical protein
LVGIWPRACCLGRPLRLAHAVCCCLPRCIAACPLRQVQALSACSAQCACPQRQAHFINNRTMEVFRQLRAGGAPGRPGAALAAAAGAGASLADALAAASPPLEQWRRFVYCESALGAVLGETDHFPARLRGPGRASG